MEVTAIKLHSVKCSYALLVSIVKRMDNNTDYTWLIPSLASQTAFARFSSAEHSIVSCALGTFKRASMQVVPGGFKTIDELRRSALNLLKHPIAGDEQSPKRDTVRSLRLQKSNLELEIKHLEQHALHLTYVLREIKRMYKSISNCPPEFIVDCYERDIKELNAMDNALSLNIWNATNEEITT